MAVEFSFLLPLESERKKRKRFPRTRQSIGKGKKVCFLKSAAAYAAERPLFLDSFLKLKICGL
jgi:hypothetical protein